VNTCSSDTVKSVKLHTHPATRYTETLTYPYLKSMASATKYEYIATILIEDLVSEFVFDWKDVSGSQDALL